MILRGGGRSLDTWRKVLVMKFGVEIWDWIFFIRIWDWEEKEKLEKIMLDYIRWIFWFGILYSTIHKYKRVGNGEIKNRV